MKYTVRTVPDLKLCKCAGDIVWTLKTCLWEKKILGKCVGEKDEEDKIEHKTMFTDVWIFVWIFFRL